MDFWSHFLIDELDFIFKKDSIRWRDNHWRLCICKRLSLSLEIQMEVYITVHFSACHIFLTNQHLQKSSTSKNVSFTLVILLEIKGRVFKYILMKKKWMYEWLFCELFVIAPPTNSYLHCPELHFFFWIFVEASMKELMEKNFWQVNWPSSSSSFRQPRSK